MSEYQAYHFFRINRAFSAKERKAVKGLSSHISVSADSAFVEYHYGDFKHDPINVLQKHFDMFVYYADWGSQMIGFRFDEAMVDYEAMAAYAVEDTLTITRKDGQILVVAIFDENYNKDFFGDYYDADEAVGSSFSCLYNEKIEGDYRALFILWLKASQFHPTPDRVVSIPYGMSMRHEAHDDLIEFVGLDADLVSEAAAASPALKKSKRKTFEPEKHLHLIDDATQKEYLSRLLTEDPNQIRAEIIGHLRRVAPGLSQGKTPQTSTQVTYLELEAKAESRRVQRKREKEAALHAERDAYLRELKEHAPKMWRKVPELIERKNTKNYELAVEVLQALKCLAIHENQLSEFYNCSDAIVNQYPRLVGMRSRMQSGEVISDQPEKLPIRDFIQKQRPQRNHLPDKPFSFKKLDF